MRSEWRGVAEEKVPSLGRKQKTTPREGILSSATIHDSDSFEVRGNERRGQRQLQLTSKSLGQHGAIQWTAEDLGGGARVECKRVPILGRSRVHTIPSHVAMSGAQGNGSVTECRAPREARGNPGHLEGSHSDLPRRGAREARLRSGNERLRVSRAKARARSGGGLDPGRGKIERAKGSGQRVRDPIREFSGASSPWTGKACGDRERKLLIVEDGVASGRPAHDVDAIAPERGQIP